MPGTTPERSSITTTRSADHVALVEIDHPPANSLTLEMRRRLADLWGELQRDDDVRAVVVTGAGDRFFSAGLDMDELAGWHEHASAEQRHRWIDQLTWDPWSNGLTKPLLAAIDGYCLAGGFYLAQMCDVRIAGVDAVFGIPEARWNHPAVFAGDLAQQLPLNLALEMVLWAERTHSAERMYELGFLNEVVADEEPRQVALRWATEVAELPPRAVQIHKRLLYEAANTGGPDDRARRERLVRPLHAMRDAAEGIRAFRERRRPDFRGV